MICVRVCVWCGVLNGESSKITTHTHTHTRQGTTVMYGATHCFKCPLRTVRTVRHAVRTKQKETTWYSTVVLFRTSVDTL